MITKINKSNFGTSEYYDINEWEKRGAYNTDKIFKVKNKDDSKKIIELCDKYGKNYHITPQFNITYNKNKTMFEVFHYVNLFVDDKKGDLNNLNGELTDYGCEKFAVTLSEKDYNTIFDSLIDMCDYEHDEKIEEIMGNPSPKDYEHNSFEKDYMIKIILKDPVTDENIVKKYKHPVYKNIKIIVFSTKDDSKIEIINTNN